MQRSRNAIKFFAGVRACLTLFSLFFLGCDAVSSRSGRGDVVTLGPERGLVDLFLHDDFLVAATEGLELVPAKARKHPLNPVLLKDRPWERGILDYTFVMQDHETGTYKMWYQMIQPSDDGNQS